MDFFKLVLDYSVLVVNLLSVEIGLVVGIGIRALFIDTEKIPVGRQLITFVLFSLALCYLAAYATFSEWPYPAIGYALLGVVAPPLTPAFYRGLVAVAPTVIKNCLPDWLLKFMIERSAPTSRIEANSEKETKNE